MNKTLIELAARIGCTVNNLRQYLGRAEFSHIKRIWNDKKKRFEFTAIELIDIDRLKRLVKTRKYGMRHKGK